MVTRLTAISTATALVAGLAIALATSPNKPAAAREESVKRVVLSYSLQGDSLSVMAKPYLKRALARFKQRSFSAQIGRHYWDGEQLLKKQRLGRVVIFALGSNSWQSSPSAFRKAIRRIVDYIGPRRCLIMATIYDQRPIGSFNKIIYQEARRAGAGRFQVAPWAEIVSADKVKLTDGLHPQNKSGARAFARLLSRAAKSCSLAD